MNIAVVGKGRDCPKEVYALARSVGEMIARAGHVAVTGGLGGVMEGALCGAKSAGGLTVGIVPRLDVTLVANDYIDVLIRTDLTEVGRNIITAATADAMVVLFGSHGTLQEIAIARERQIPMIACDTNVWELAPICLSSRSREDVARWLGDLSRLAMVDVIVQRAMGKPQVMLVKRDSDPFRGLWALPGGRIEKYEDPRHAAVRELAEETGTVVDTKSLLLVKRYDDPDRDPRGASVSYAFTVLDEEIESGPTNASWHDVENLPTPLAFDHERMIVDAIKLAPR